jgi:SHAQKYF class myb-like DNA-binding protein
MSDYSSNQQATPPSKKVAGRWTRIEHDRFIKALEKFGRDWISVQKFVRTRSLSQVRSHAQKFFMKISPDDISAMIAGEEDSDFYTSNPGHETAYHQKNRGKKNATRFDYPVKSLNSQKKPVQSEKKEDLL